MNSVDAAIRVYRSFDLSRYQKLDEVPYDFVRMRKRLSIRVSTRGGHLMVTKGALRNILEVCSSAETAIGQVMDISSVRDERETLRGV